MNKYTSDRVFEGKYFLTNEEAERHRERLKRALDKRNDKMTNKDGGSAF